MDNENVPLLVAELGAQFLKDWESRAVARPAPQPHAAR